jgi:hypothetical protein
MATRRVLALRIPLPDGEDDLTDSEALGLAVAIEHGQAIQARDDAREIAVRLEQDAAEARRHLAAVLGVIAHQGWRSSWLENTVALTRAQSFLLAAEVPVEPVEPEPGD